MGEARVGDWENLGPVPGEAMVAKLAFDDQDRYELRALGKQFARYAMTELPLRLKYEPDDFSGPEADPPPKAQSPSRPDGEPPSP
jgi:hypothetical protein